MLESRCHRDQAGTKDTILLHHGQGIYSARLVLKDYLEFLETDLIVFGDVMRSYHLRYFVFGDLSAPKAFKHVDEVLFADKVCVIDVKSLEEAMQDIVSQVVFQVERRRQKLSVVDLSVANVVDLGYDFANCVLIDTQVYFCHRLRQFLLVDTAAATTVNLLKLTAQGLNLFLHFVDHV